MAEQSQTILDFNDPELQAEMNKAGVTPKQVVQKAEETGTNPADALRMMLATGVRVASPWAGRIAGAAGGATLGSLAGPGGTVAGGVAGGVAGSGLGSAAGEAIAEMIEPGGKLGDYKRISPKRVAVEGAIGAIPIPGASSPPAKAFIKGAALAGAGTVGRRMAGGEEFKDAANPLNWSLLEDASVIGGGALSSWLSKKGAGGTKPPATATPPPAPLAPKTSSNPDVLKVIVEKVKKGVPLNESEAASYKLHTEDLKKGGLPETASPDQVRNAAEIDVKGRVANAKKADADTVALLNQGLEDEAALAARDVKSEKQAQNLVKLRTQKAKLIEKETNDETARILAEREAAENAKKAEDLKKTQVPQTPKISERIKAGDTTVTIPFKPQAEIDEELRKAAEIKKAQEGKVPSTRVSESVSAKMENGATGRKTTSFTEPEADDAAAAGPKKPGDVNDLGSEGASPNNPAKLHVLPAGTDAETASRIAGANKAKDLRKRPDGRFVVVFEKPTSLAAPPAAPPKPPAPPKVAAAPPAPPPVVPKAPEPLATTPPIPKPAAPAKPKLGKNPTLLDILSQEEEDLLPPPNTPKPEPPKAPEAPPAQDPLVGKSPADRIPILQSQMEAELNPARKSLIKKQIQKLERGLAKAGQGLKVPEAPKAPAPEAPAVAPPKVPKNLQEFVKNGFEPFTDETGTLKFRDKNGDIFVPSGARKDILAPEKPKAPAAPSRYPVKGSMRKAVFPDEPKTPPAAPTEAPKAPEVGGEGVTSSQVPKGPVKAPKAHPLAGLNKVQRVEKLLEGTPLEKITPELRQHASDVADAGLKYEKAMTAYKADPSNAKLRAAAKAAGAEASSLQKSLDEVLKGPKTVGPAEAAPKVSGLRVAQTQEPGVAEPKAPGTRAIKQRKAPPGQAADDLKPTTAPEAGVERDLSKPLLTYDDMVKLSGVSQKNIYRALRGGFLKEMPTAERSVRVHPDDFAEWLKKGRPTGGRQSGFATPDLLMRMGLGGLGAATGAAADEDHPLQGALMGGLAGVAAPSIAKRIPELIAASQNGKLGEAVNDTWKELPNYQRFSLLSEPTSLAINTAAPVGSGIMGAIERALSGDSRGLKMLDHMMDVDENLKNASSAWKRAMSGAERNTRADMNFQGPLSPAEKILAGPGALMTTGDIAVQDVGKRAGFSPEMMQKMTLTSEPEWSVSKGIMNFGRGSDSVWPKLMLPFKRTALNIVESGAERIPGVGVLFELAKDPQAQATVREMAVKQGMGAAVFYLSKKAGENTDPDNAKLAQKMITNLSGQYAMLAAAGFAAGQAELKGTNPEENWIDKNIGSTSAITGSALRDFPLPTTQALGDIAKSGAGIISQSPAYPDKEGPAKWLPRWTIPGLVNTAGNPDDESVQELDDLIRRLMGGAQAPPPETEEEQ